MAITFLFTASGHYDKYFFLLLPDLGDFQLAVMLPWIVCLKDTTELKDF